MLYTAETEVGMTIIEAESEKDAFEHVRKEVGSYFDIYNVRRATDEDIAWYKHMSGRMVCEGN